MIRRLRGKTLRFCDSFSSSSSSSSLNPTNRGFGKIVILLLYSLSISICFSSVFLSITSFCFPVWFRSFLLLITLLIEIVFFAIFVRGFSSATDILATADFVVFLVDFWFVELCCFESCQFNAAILFDRRGFVAERVKGIAFI